MTRPKLGLAAAVLVVLVILAGCGSGTTTTQPAGSDGSAGTTASTPTHSSDEPTPPASGSVEEDTAALVPPIDPAHDVRAQATRGAFALIVIGEFGRAEATGQAECMWGRDVSPAAFQSLDTTPVTLLGEQVVLNVDHTPTLNRSEAARYIPKGGLSWDPTPIGDAVVARSTDLEVDTGAAVPGGADPSTYTANLGGRADTASLDVTVAWRCEQPSGSANETAAAATEAPTPVCPPRLPGSPPPVGALVLDSGTAQVDGVKFSSDFVTCTDDGAADGDWAVPDSALAVSGSAPMTLSLGGPGSMFDVTAFYAPASTDTTPTNMLTLGVHPGPSTNSYLVDLPPAGDWALVVNTGIADADHGRVENATFIYRVQVAR